MVAVPVPHVEVGPLSPLERHELFVELLGRGLVAPLPAVLWGGSGQLGLVPPKGTHYEMEFPATPDGQRMAKAQTTLLSLISQRYCPLDVRATHRPGAGTLITVKRVE